MKKHLFTFSVFITLCLSVTAQEGMWLLSQIEQLGLEQKGLKIDPSDIYHPDKPALYNAIIQLGGGTASFVSPEGLIITNHHVAYGALQRASSVNNDYLTHGFLANSKSEEISAPGYQARLLTEMTDITEKILKEVKGIKDPTEKDRKINAKIVEITESLEKKSDDVNARVAEMYNGKQYFLFVYKVFKDIRIVYSPPMSIGKFGGDIDNWMWPRHTGDFSFLRVYASPKGEGSEFNEANIPYKPKVWLKVATEDLKDGDFTFILGFPGATTRYRTSNSASWNLKYNYPFSIQNFGEIIGLMDELTADDHEGQIKVASLHAGLANAMKNYQGKVEGMKKIDFIQKKLDFEAEFMDWVNSSPETQKKYGHILDDIAKTYKTIEVTKDRDNVMGILGGLAGTQLSVALQLYGVKKELEKPAKERRPGYSEKILDNMKEQLPYYFANYYEPLDKAMFIRALKLVNELPDDQRIEGFEYIFNDNSISIEQFADNAFSTSQLNDVDFVEGLLDKSVDELEAMNDPFLQMAANIWPLQEESNKTTETFAANVTELRMQYINALYEWKGSTMYPDANSTMRFTSGPVKGYSPEDAVWYKPFTSLKGVIDKDTGKEPFDVPKELKALYQNRDFGQWADPELNDIPVAFTHQCDITGGNSGSPVMNAKGEIIGVAFDGNYEAMIGDWQYDYELQRTISVDIRYCLFITNKFGGAGYLLEEMGVNK